MKASRYYSRALFAVHRPNGPRRTATRDYLVHQLVADLFPDRDERGYLYRVVHDSPGKVQTLILSTVPPLSQEDRPVRDWGSTISMESKHYAPQLATGQIVDYEVRINATISVDGRRTDVWDAVFAANRNDPRSPEEAYAAYLTGRLGGAARIRATHLTERGFTSMRRGVRSERAVTFVSANLAGSLEVLDGKQLVDVITRGVGRAKAFGHGLMCLSSPGTVLPRAIRNVTA